MKQSKTTIKSRKTALEIPSGMTHKERAAKHPRHKDGKFTKLYQEEKESVSQDPEELPIKLFHVERVAGHHQCMFSRTKIIKDFIQKFNCQPLDGQTLNPKLIAKKPS